MKQLNSGHSINHILFPNWTIEERGDTKHSVYVQAKTTEEVPEKIPTSFQHKLLIWISRESKTITQKSQSQTLSFQEPI